MNSRPHINENGKFQSDKYPDTPEDAVLLKLKDPAARAVLRLYAELRRPKDEQFADDLLWRINQIERDQK